MLSTILAFTAKVKELSDISDAYDIFEYDCSEDLRDEIYNLSDPQNPEPFRSAMHRLGFTNY